MVSAGQQHREWDALPVGKDVVLSARSCARTRRPGWDRHVLHASVLYRGELRKEAHGCWRFSRLFIGCDLLLGGGGPGLEDEPNPEP